MEECDRGVGFVLGLDLRLNQCRECDLWRVCVDARRKGSRFLDCYFQNVPAMVFETFPKASKNSSHAVDLLNSPKATKAE